MTQETQPITQYIEGGWYKSYNICAWFSKFQGEMLKMVELGITCICCSNSWVSPIQSNVRLAHEFSVPWGGLWLSA